MKIFNFRKETKVEQLRKNSALRVTITVILGK